MACGGDTFAGHFRNGTGLPMTPARKRMMGVWRPARSGVLARLAQTIRLSSLNGPLYLNPTLQVGCAALIMGDPVTRWHGAALTLIRAGLVLVRTGGRPAPPPGPRHR